MKRFVDYVIDRAVDRAAQRLFERYGDDMSAMCTNIATMLLPIRTNKPLPPKPEDPPAPGLRSV